MPILNPIEGSRNVHSAGYDDSAQMLSVRFWRYVKGGQPVPGDFRYDYLLVEPDIAHEFFAADSKSKYLETAIKPTYGFTKVDLTKPEDGSDVNG